jgi:hypothetical protein
MEMPMGYREETTVEKTSALMKKGSGDMAILEI